MTLPTNGITPTNTNNKIIWKRPTIPHCSFATLIGFCIRVKLLRSLPSRFKVEVRINPGSHSSEGAVNQQLADKERLSAALENEKLLGVVNKCIVDGMMLWLWWHVLTFWGKRGKRGSYFSGRCNRVIWIGELRRYYV